MSAHRGDTPHQLALEFIADDAIVAGLIDPAINEWGMDESGLWHYTSKATVAQFRRALTLLPSELRHREVVISHNMRMLERT